MDPFENAANADFTLEASRQQMQAGLGRCGRNRGGNTR